MSPHYLVKCTTFSSDWMYVAFLQTLVALKNTIIILCWKKPVVGWQLGIGGSENNRLWCEANGMSSKQRYSKCSKWPPSVRIHASNLFRHWSTASFTTLCWNSAHVATRRFRNSSVSQIGTRYAWKKWKSWKMCAFYKVMRWYFSGVVGNGVTVCFLPI